ncbi:hypothetical protein FA15DRAFT_674862 [Coprinopsis marcescibilis]|uniref:Uncharacterized protein n=1 Tax=Coprinopsis marcescibilis TaxID=230819 RepID=A0A5C3KG51_COPMA|nr:hypothetical protein FA15DRAFT_674862 [Coprinopsis marcescibilis]
MDWHPQLQNGNGPEGQVKLTLYHLFVFVSTCAFGFSKAWLAHQGYSTEPTTIDWLSGVLLFLAIYWLGIIERHSDHRMPWLFEYNCLSPVLRMLDRYRQARPPRGGNARLE